MVFIWDLNEPIESIERMSGLSKFHTDGTLKEGLYVKVEVTDEQMTT